MSLAHWIGKPYADKGRGPDEFDCWGYVRAVLAERGTVLPDYSDAYESADDHEGVSAAVLAGLADGWRAVTRPVAFDLVIINVAQRPWHCGLMIAPDRFVHCPPPNPHTRVQTYSCVERTDSPRWHRRIEGYYRHV